MSSSQNLPTIGFGTSGLAGSGLQAQRERLLDVAVAAGVRHIDTARYYGQGFAEQSLNPWLKKNRSKVTLATKAGISPLPLPSAIINKVLNVGAQKIKPLRGPLLNLKAKIKQPRSYSPESIKASLEASLSALGTDYVDYFLLHEASPEDVSPDLIELLQSFIKRGLVRVVGVGSEIDRVRKFTEKSDSWVGILQHESSLLRPGTVQNVGDRIESTHGAIAGSFSSIIAFLEANPGTDKSWSDEVGLDLTQRANISNALLSYAARSNVDIVLFSSTNAERIEQNCQAFLNPALDADGLDRLIKCVENAGLRTP